MVISTVEVAESPTINTNASWRTTYGIITVELYIDF